MQSVKVCLEPVNPDIYAAVVEWQTRHFEGVVRATGCEFESHLPHKNIAV